MNVKNNKLDGFDSSQEDEGLSKFVDQIIKDMIDKKNENIAKVLAEKPYKLNQALAYLSTELDPATNQDLAYLVARKILTPCFLYKGELIRVYKEIPHDDEVVIEMPNQTNIYYNAVPTDRIKFFGYVTPSDDLISSQIMMNQGNVTVLKVDIFQTIESSEMDQDDSLLSDNSLDYYEYEVTKNSNYLSFTQNQGVELNLADCFFLKHELETIINFKKLKLLQTGTLPVDGKEGHSKELEYETLNQRYQQALQELAKTEKYKFAKSGSLLIGVLLNYFLNNSIKSKANQSYLIDKILTDYPDIRGLGQKTIEDHFAISNDLLDNLSNSTKKT